MSDILGIFSILFLPLLITLIILYGIIKKAPVYDIFIDGAKDGLKTCIDILPFIIGIFIAIEALTTSGAMDFIQKLSRPLFDFLGIPEELISLILLRPVSGSGSLVVAEKIMQEVGPDSFAGRAASVMVGSCETIFYVLALYFSVTSVKKMRHAFAAGLAGYIAGIFASVYICRFI
ncbi:MAG: spore maturation protein [Bacillota bacterium]|nr:spore maturation protein [Bacillota bacterium]